LALIEPILVYGVILGAIYALLALGFTLIYGVCRVVNLTHGSFFMLGAYAFYTFETWAFFQLAPIPALILGTIVVGIIGGIVYRLFVHPVIGDEVTVMVVTVSLALIIQQLTLLIFSSTLVPVPPLLKGSILIWGVATDQLGHTQTFILSQPPEGWTLFQSVTETYSRLLALAASLGLFVSLWVFISKSKIGRAMRAVSQDREAAMLMGVNTERLYILTMGISAAFAALAGIFIASSTLQVAYPYMWLSPLAMSFAIVILGGLGSIKGTFIGGFIIGFLENAVAILIPQGGNLVPAIPFITMVVILFLRPKGLFGKRIELEE